ncbi:TIGR03768 family metallophosphoesterase [Geobacter sp. AOG2]|uniref:TIGR03768 family metallophosphoesterase n=1 Tax=Geobacter sp. AOG2 TaxID=1566347 RepID=UPI001CC7BABD|nr:TIGR03768 family metallophosphoesterase [Geobacter sp. AOG2]GFE62895.1 metallophosphoesterase [Geobacter sp. AOG2]
MVKDDPAHDSIDSTFNSSVNRREFIKVSAGALACASISPVLFGCGTSGGSQVAGYPISSTAYTTLQKTIVPGTTTGALAPPYLNQISLYDQNGYGEWSYGAPLPSEKRTDIMPPAYQAPAINNPAKLLRFFAMTDVHITDKESPSQLIYMQPLDKYGVEAGVTSVYSPTMMYTTQMLDAVIQTVNALHKQDPIDFGISLGDSCNSTQYNELRWYIDVIDGKVIDPSSGAHAGTGTIDYQKPFKAAGLDPSIPWYQARGNHDSFWLGSVPPDVQDGNGRSLRGSCASDEVLAIVDLLASPNNIYNTSWPQYYMGVIDGSTPNGNIIKYGAVSGLSSPPKVVADPDRRSLASAEWVREFFNTSTRPAGHGFNLVPAGQEAGFACYSFVPKSDIPIKVIVLDNTQREDDGSISIHGHGFLDQARWDWLKAELAAGDATATDAGQLMIIAAHIPISVQKAGTWMEWFDNTAAPASPASPSPMANAVTLADLLAELHSHPNLLMWIAGHRHVNAVKAFASPDPSAPENGFWQVETSSLHDFPQQFRTFDINLNSDYSVSIVTTNVDPAVKDGTPAAKSLKYAVAAQQIVKSAGIYQADVSTNCLVDPVTQASTGVVDPSIRPMPTGSYNAELFKQLSPAMTAALQKQFPA